MNTQQQQNFFNLHVSGVGYVNRVRWVEPSRQAGRRSEAFLACSISALRGSVENPANTYFDLRVSGEEAIKMVDQLQDDVQARAKVFVSFKVGDIYPHLYQRKVRDPQTGKPTGEMEWATLIKGRLLLINSITIDGERVFTRDADGEPTMASDEAAQQPAAVQPEPEPAMQRAQVQRHVQPQAAERGSRGQRWNRNARNAGRQVAQVAARVARA